MFTDDHLRREIDDILNRKPSATRKEIVEALYWRATLKWGRVPEMVKVWYRQYNTPDEILAKYSPDQPRVPAGNSDGGQWTRDPNASEGGREARQNATYDYLRDKKGNLIRNINGDVIPYPREFPPEYFLKRAEAALPKDESNIETIKRADKILADILKFRHGQMWAVQRRFTEGSRRSDFNENLRGYSTIAIGTQFQQAFP